MIILGTNSIKDTGFNVANSCRFDDGSSAYLYKADPGSSGNRKTWTLSLWFKRGNLGTVQTLFSSGAGGHVYEGFVRINASDRLEFKNDGQYGGEASPTRVLRDVGAWYHLCWSVDATQGSNDNRWKIYLNGTLIQASEYSSVTIANADGNILDFDSNASDLAVGRNERNDNGYWDGYISEVVFIDGTQEAVTSFGEFDEDSPTIWKPKDVSGLSLGTNGFYLDFEDSSDLGADAKGSFDFTANNLAATDQTTDTPTNNFCTMNAVGSHGSVTLAEGNIQVNVADNTDNASGTFFVDKGKWYVELKYTAQSSSDDLIMFGIRPDTMNIYQSNIFNLTGVGQGLYYYGDSGNQRPANTSYGNAVALNDILGVYIDLDNNKLYFAINGTVQASGTGISIPTTSDYYTFSFTSGGQSDTAQVNFGGCPTYTISSGNADANGYGNFEYSPSAGTFDSASKDFYALCTKNLAEFG